MELNDDLREIISEFLPRNDENSRCHVTLTYAQSLDAKIAAKKDTRTPISHQETKNMTHFLRSTHSGIVVGVSTFLVDNPSLLNKFSDNHKITPIIIDPLFKTKSKYPTSQLLENVRSGVGLRPLVVVSTDVYNSQKQELDSFCENFPLKVLPLDTDASGRFDWCDVFIKLTKYVDSVMVEGGANVINELLLRPDLVDSLIVTIGAVYLGVDGVSVEPKLVSQLTNVKWWHGDYDTVMMANLKY